MTISQKSFIFGYKAVYDQLIQNPSIIDTVFIERADAGRHSKKKNKEADIIALCKASGIRFKLAGVKEFSLLCPEADKKIAARLFHAGFVELEALFHALGSAPVPLLVALDQVQDTGNVGTLARTVYALGAAGLLVPKDRSAYLGAAAYKASTGTLARLPVCRVVNLARALDSCRDQGLTVYGATAASETTHNLYTTNLLTPAVVVLGNEDKGIRPNVAKRCHTLCSIPLARPCNSLNVAQAGAIFLAAFARSVQCHDEK